jgi:hypothetical protein
LHQRYVACEADRKPLLNVGLPFLSPNGFGFNALRSAARPATVMTVAGVPGK